MEDKKTSRRLVDSGFGSSQRTDEGASQQPFNYTNRRRDDSTQERLSRNVSTQQRPVNYSNRPRDDSTQERLSRSVPTQQRPVNYSNRPRDDSTQERLEFDADSGKLVVSRNPEASQVVSVRHVPAVVPEVPAPVPDRPVVDAMAAQGFF